MKTIESLGFPGPKPSLIDGNLKEIGQKVTVAKTNCCLFLKIILKKDKKLHFEMR